MLRELTHLYPHIVRRACRRGNQGPGSCWWPWPWHLHKWFPGWCAHRDSVSRSDLQLTRPQHTETLCSPGQAKALAEKMLGQTLVTKQSMLSACLLRCHNVHIFALFTAGAEGRKCEKVLLMERLYMRREMYLSILMDR